MASIIFPSCSYFICFGAEPELQNRINLIAQNFRSRVHHCENIESLELALQTMRRKVSCFAIWDGVDPETKKGVTNLIEQAQLSCTSFSKNSTDAIIKSIFQETIQKLIPKNLNTHILFAANSIFPKFFQGIGVFTEANHAEDLQKFDRQMIYSTIHDDLMGFCSVKASVEQMQKKWPNLTGDKIIGDLKESINQFLGVITQSLSKLDLNPKIGLPTVFDLRKIPEVQTLTFFPSVMIQEALGLMTLSLGYCHLENEPMFDLSNVDTSSSSDEVEFL